MKCKRGNIAARDKQGHCLCVDCKKFRKSRVDANRKKINQYQKEWQQNNPDRCKLYRKKWQENNKAKMRLIEKSWKSRNPEKVKEYNKKSGAKWAKNNKGKRNAIDMKRKAAKIKRTPSWANLVEIEKIYIEAARLTKETGIVHEVDHIIPLQGDNVSGLHVHNNLQILTRSENRSKKNKVNILNP